MNQTFELPDGENDPLNHRERMILDGFTLAQTQTYGQYFATVAREAAQIAQAEFGGSVIENATVYRVDGEIGRVTFPTYALRKEGQTVWNSVPDVFEAQGPREYYHTESAKERLLDLASFASYRNTARVFHRIRRTAPASTAPP